MPAATRWPPGAVSVAIFGNRCCRLARFEPVELGGPTIDLGLVSGQHGSGFGHARLGRLHVGGLHFLQLPGQPDALLVELDRRFLGAPIFHQLGHEQPGEHRALFHSIADVDIPLLDAGA